MAATSGPLDDAPTEGRGHRALEYIGDLLRRYWGTAFVVACVIVAGLVTGALWKNVAEGIDLYNDVAYGLPALEDRRQHL